MPWVENGQVVARKMMQVRFSFEERIDDGLNASYGIAAVKRILEDPFKYFGCVAEDGADRTPFGVSAERDLERAA